MPYVQVLCNVYIISVSRQFILIYMSLLKCNPWFIHRLLYHSILCCDNNFYNYSTYTQYIRYFNLDFDKILITGTKELPVFRPIICVTSISSWCPGARQKIKKKKIYAWMQSSDMRSDSLHTFLFASMLFNFASGYYLEKLFRKYSKYISCNECFSVTRAR